MGSCFSPTFLSPRNLLSSGLGRTGCKYKPPAGPSRTPRTPSFAGEGRRGLAVSAPSLVLPGRLCVSFTT